MSWAAHLRWPLRHLLGHCWRRLTGKTGVGAVMGVCIALAAASGAVAAPSDIAIIITNSNYDDASIPAVKYAANDGKAIEEAMTQLFGVPTDNIRKIVNASGSDLRDLFGQEGSADKSELFRLVQSAKGRDRNARVYVYYSGHGTPRVRDDGAGTDAWLVTRDAKFRNLPATAYSLKTLRDNLAAIKALIPDGQIVLILEACFSGRTGNDEPLRPGTSAVPVTVDMGDGPTGPLIELDAAQGDQAAFWDEKTRHGVFTDQLLFGLYGKADAPEFGGNGDGQVTLAELTAFLEKRIPDRLKINRRIGEQTANVVGAPDLALAAGGPQRRPDTRELESDEEARCGALEKAENENYTRLGENIAAIRKFLDEDCRLCECRAKLETRARIIEERQQACVAVFNKINDEKDPEVLQYYADHNQCPQLHDTVVRKVKLLQDVRQQKVCAEDQKHWDEVKHGESLNAMEDAIDTLFCPSVRDSAREEVTQRRGLQASITAMKSTAADLGTLQAGRTVDRQGAVRDEGPAAYWKFQVAADDIVGIQLTGLTADLDVDLRDSSYGTIASSRRRSAAAKEIQASLKAGATYYIRIAPADGNRGSAYTLRAARGPFRMADFTRPEVAARAVIGGALLTHTLTTDYPEYYARFTVRDPAAVSIDLAWADRETKVDMDLLKEEPGRSPAPKASVALNTGRRVVDALQPGTYLVRVTRSAGPSAATPITVNLRSVPAGSSKELAAPLMVGAAPVTYTLPANENHYWGRFSLMERSKITAVLNWSNAQVDLDVEVWNDSASKALARTNRTQQITTEQVEPVLEQGTYLVHIYRTPPTSLAAAPFQLTLTGTGAAAQPGGRRVP
jgi:hypothetical protein